MQRTSTAFLPHTYTRQQRSVTVDSAGVPVEDDWAQPVTGFGPATAGLACFYEVQDRTVVTPTGNIIVNVPILMVAHDDPLDDGDVVTNVATKDGRVLVGGPVVAENVNPVVPNDGGPLLNQAELRVVQAVPTSIP